jgi:hypothetical protein
LQGATAVHDEPLGGIAQELGEQLRRLNAGTSKVSSAMEMTPSANSVQPSAAATKPAAPRTNGSAMGNAQHAAQAANNPRTPVIAFIDASPKNQIGYTLIPQVT